LFKQQAMVDWIESEIDLIVADARRHGAAGDGDAPARTQDVLIL